MKKSLFLVTLLVISFSCQNDQEFEIISERQNTLENEVKNSYEENYYVHKMAELLSNAIAKSPEVVKFLQKKAEQKIDGDFDVLLSQIIDTGNSNDQLYEAISIYNKANISKVDLGRLIDDVKRNVPLLNIYFPPTDQEKINNDFLTIILEPSFDDSKDRVVQAINKKGEIIEITTDEEPEIPYMVVGINERLIPVPKEEISYITNRAVFSSEYYSYYLPNCYNVEDEKFPFIVPTAIGVKERGLEQDIISRAKFKSSDAIKAVEKWLRGAPEVHLTVIYADYSPVDLLVGPLLHNLEFNLGDDNWYTGPRRKKNPCDNYGNWYTTDWINCQKKYMKYHFTEMDNGFSITINGWDINVSGGDLIGGCKVNYQDVSGKTYHISDKFEFDVKW